MGTPRSQGKYPATATVEQGGDNYQDDYESDAETIEFADEPETIQWGWSYPDYVVEPAMSDDGGETDKFSSMDTTAGDEIKKTKKSKEMPTRARIILSGMGSGDGNVRSGAHFPLRGQV